MYSMFANMTKEEAGSVFIQYVEFEDLVSSLSPSYHHCYFINFIYLFLMSGFNCGTWVQLPLGMWDL